MSEDARKTRGKRWWWSLAVLALVVYVTSYLWVSRQAYGWSEDAGFGGVFYFSPDHLAEGMEWKYRVVYVVFWPANQVDRLVFSGKEAVGPDVYRRG